MAQQNNQNQQNMNKDNQKSNVSQQQGGKADRFKGPSESESQRTDTSDIANQNQNSTARK